MKFNLWPPALIFYCKEVPGMSSEKALATAKTFCVWIENSVKDDECILQHELEHVKQFYRTCGIHIFLLLIPKYKKWCEERAYKVQNTCYRDTLGI